MKYIWPYIYWIIKKLSSILICVLTLIQMFFHFLWCLNLKEVIKALEYNNIENYQKEMHLKFKQDLPTYKEVFTYKEYKSPFHELFGIYKEYTI